MSVSMNKNPDVRARKKILIVEDSKALQQVLVQRASKMFDVECLVDTTGESCMNLCKEKKPDLVILDMGLPRVSGLSLLRAIKNTIDTKDIPVIAYSAYSYKELVDECSDLGIDSYVSKSEPISNLFQLIEQHLQLH